MQEVENRAAVEEAVILAAVEEAALLRASSIVAVAVAAVLLSCWPALLSNTLREATEARTITFREAVVPIQAGLAA